ncbi:MAG: sigma-70 family RNA polymerase sigma factor [Alphaproteobacteria bacterium]|nr:sigma-70 family RNA polymerase sigma factor [Alphaproteobacteria bacterium]
MTKKQLNSISSYTRKFLEQIRAIPFLGKKEEHRLATHFRDFQDKESAEKLVLSHLHLVVSLSYSFQNYNVHFEDLLSQGTIGLLQAVQSFDPDHGTRLSTHAQYWIKAALYDFVQNNNSIIKSGRSSDMRKLFFKLSSAKEKLGISHKKSLNTEDIERLSSNLGVSAKAIRQSEGDRQAIISLNSPQSKENHEEKIGLVASPIEDPGIKTERTDLRKKMLKATTDFLETIDDRDKDIFTSRYLSVPPKTLENIANRLKVSKQSVHQRAEKTVKLLRTFIRKRYPDEKI